MSSSSSFFYPVTFDTSKECIQILPFGAQPAISPRTGMKTVAPKTGAHIGRDMKGNSGSYATTYP